MSKHFTPCPACGAVGEVNSVCQFCGTTILLKEGATPSDTRIIKQRTVTPQQYAEKVSIYHNIENINAKLIKVSIGNQFGVINLNGDLILPLENYFDIKRGFNEHIVEVYKIDKYHRFYINLENMEEADCLGFIRDERNWRRILRIVDRSSWTTKEFKNLDGLILSYDYFEMEGPVCTFHKGETCFLGIYRKGIVLEEVKTFGEVFELKDKKYIPVKRLNGQTINLPVFYKKKEGDVWKWEWYEEEELIVEWYKQTGTVIPPFLGVQLTKSKTTEERKGTKSVSQKWDSESLAYLATVVICVPASIFLFVTASEFEDTEYFLGAILAAGCSIWGIIKMISARNRS